MTDCCVLLTAGKFILSLSKGGTSYLRARHSRDKPPVLRPLMELIAIRLMKQLAIPLSNQKTVANWLVIGWQTTPAKSLVMSSVP